MRTCACGAALDYATENITVCHVCRAPDPAPFYPGKDYGPFCRWQCTVCKRGPIPITQEMFNAVSKSEIYIECKCGGPL